MSWKDMSTQPPKNIRNEQMLEARGLVARCGMITHGGATVDNFEPKAQRHDGSDGTSPRSQGPRGGHQQTGHGDEELGMRMNGQPTAPALKVIEDVPRAIPKVPTSFTKPSNRKPSQRTSWTRPFKCPGNPSRSLEWIVHKVEWI